MNQTSRTSPISGSLLKKTNASSPAIWTVCGSLITISGWSIKILSKNQNFHIIFSGIIDSKSFGIIHEKAQFFIFISLREFGIGERVIRHRLFAFIIF